MAYNNWGGFVYCNGLRVPEREDCAFPITTDNSKMHMWHALSGNGEVRIAGYKDHPTLLIAGEPRIPIHAYLLSGQHPNECLWLGKLRKHYFGARKFDLKERNLVVETFLIEPDGTYWTSTFGFWIGKGFETVVNSTAAVVRPNKDWRPLFQHIAQKHPQATHKYARDLVKEMDNR